MGTLSRLSKQEEQCLAECEQVIQQGLQPFVAVGLALSKIRAGRLYRQEFETFEDYCRVKWQISRIYAYRLIGAAGVVQNLLLEDELVTERKLRPLTSLSPEGQRQAWDIATQQNANPSAATIRAAVQRIRKNGDEIISASGEHRISLGRIEREMSLEDLLADLEFTFIQRACEAIETRSRSQTETQKHLDSLTRNSDRVQNLIRDYFS